MRLWPLVWVALAACAPSNPTTSVHLAPVQPKHVAAAPPRRPLPRSRPTLESAGAKTCRVDDAVELGPSGEGDAVLAFDASGGVAVWKESRTSLAIQPLALDGTKLGRARSVAVSEGVVPAKLRALGDRFFVLLRNETAWWSLLVDRAGRVVAPLRPAFAAKADAPARSSDEITFGVTNAAVPPPPPRRGGTIYEPMGRPVFERKLDGEPVGDPLSLEWRGNPIAHGMYVKDYVVWSGTHFLYPFSASDLGPTHDTYVELLLPIDCRP